MRIEAIAATKELMQYRELNPPASRLSLWLIVIPALLLLLVLIAVGYSII